MSQDLDGLSLNSRNIVEPDESTLLNDAAASFGTETDTEHDGEWPQTSVFVTLHRY
jgi:hypothetical protein